MALGQHRRGFTLIEIIIYFSLSLAALGILTALVTVLRRTGDHTYAQYLVSGNTATTIRFIRKELQSTALASVNVYGSKAGEEPGFSCVSAFSEEKGGLFKLGAYGTPLWQKHVSYHVSAGGQLSRVTKELSAPSFLPSVGPAPAPNGRVMMTDALPPNTAVGKFQPATTFGGLEVGFVRRVAGKDSISRVNPRDSDKPAENTRLIEVVLRSLEDGPNFMEIRFRVSPRY